MGKFVFFSDGPGLGKLFAREGESYGGIVAVVAVESVLLMVSLLSPSWRVMAVTLSALLTLSLYTSPWTAMPVTLSALLSLSLCTSMWRDESNDDGDDE